MVQSNILDRCWLVVVVAAVFTKAPKFSEFFESWDHSFYHRQDVLSGCELCRHVHAWLW